MPDRHPAAVVADLLAELKAADQLLRLMLRTMNPRQTLAFATASEAAGLGTEGASRYHERAAVIARAEHWQRNAVQPQQSTLPADAGHASSLAAKLQRNECAADRGARLTGNTQHAGAAKAYRHALALLLEQFPSALQAAVAVLNEDADGLIRADYRQALTAQALECASQPIDTHLGRPAVNDLGHGVTAVATKQSQEAVSAVPGHHQS